MDQDSSLKILVKLPVKMGDTIMAAYFLRAAKNYFPKSQLDVVLAKGLEPLLDFMPYVDNYYLFSKKEFPGPVGNYRFGRMIAKKAQYDLFFCLPFSFSSALAGFFTRAEQRIGYNTEHRGFLFTKGIKRPKDLHIVEEFNYLFEEYTGEEVAFRPLNFKPVTRPEFPFSDVPKLILNVKSGPPSRSIPIEKGISITRSLLQHFPHEIILTGAPSESGYISEIKHDFENEPRVINLAGKTSLGELAYVISKAACMVTTDSGNAHVANAVGTPTVVLFGAAHEHRAKPYDTSISRILKLSDLECVPCESEHCKYGDNRCLANIDNRLIVEMIKELMD